MSRLADLLGEASDALGPDGATPSMADLDFIADALAECRDLAAAAEARVVALEEALRRLREDMEPRLELGQWRYMPHGTARDRVEAILDALASSVKQEKEGLGGQRSALSRVEDSE